MGFLLRIELPDVPGSLGRVAAAIGTAGGNIEAIEIVEHRSDGVAVDDFFLDLPSGVLPDAIVSACEGLTGVAVQWIARYPVATNLTRDLEAVEEMSADPSRAVAVMVELIPSVFRVDWALSCTRKKGQVKILAASPAAPDELPAGFSWPDDFAGSRLVLPPPLDEVLVAGTPVGANLVLMGRNGGPEILDSEIARLSHLAALAVSISAKKG